MMYQIESDIPVWLSLRGFSTWSRNTGVITKNDELHMFGTNINGQLGIGNNKEGAKLPVKVMDNVRSVSCGSDYVLAVKKDNTLYSWGKNDYSNLLKYEEPPKEQPDAGNINNKKTIKVKKIKIK